MSFFIAALSDTSQFTGVRIYQQDVGDALKQAENAEASGEKAEDRFRKEGGDLIQNRVQLEQQEKEIKAQIRNANEQLVDLASGAAPMLLIESLLSSAGDQADLEAAGAINDSIQQLLARRDKKTIKFLAAADKSKPSRPARTQFTKRKAVGYGSQPGLEP